MRYRSREAYQPQGQARLGQDAAQPGDLPLAADEGAQRPRQRRRPEDRPLDHHTAGPGPSGSAARRAR